MYEETNTDPNSHHPDDYIILSTLFNFYKPQFSHWKEWVAIGIKLQSMPKFSGTVLHTVGAQGAPIRVSNWVCV